MKDSRTKEEKISALLARNVEDVIERAHLEAALRSGKKLRVKLGIDPTGSKIHIGRAVVLWKLREFQDLGHKAVLIIGDYTALIGDPSDKLSKRPMLTKADIKANLKTYLAQIGTILDLKKTEVRYNSEWLSKLKFIDVLALTDLWSAQQMIRRRNFADRWEKEEEISLREFMYPLMQGYDSVAVKADVELGGTDQLFNVLAGRKVQEHYGQKPQDIMTTSMILGLDGRKMSTSWGNVINIADQPDEQFGKLMSMRDEMIIPYFRALTDVADEDIKEHEAALKRGENPKNVKEKLAAAVVARYHGAKAAKAATEKWEKQFVKKEIPEDIEILDLNKNLDIATNQFAVQSLGGVALNYLLVCLPFRIMESQSKAQQLIKQGGVKVNGKTVTDPRTIVKGGDILKVGKHRLFRIKI